MAVQFLHGQILTCCQFPEPGMQRIQFLTVLFLFFVGLLWLERNVWTGNKDGIRHCQQFVINYEDSVRRRSQMEQEAAMRDSIGRLMVQQSEDIRKKMK